MKLLQKQICSSGFLSLAANKCFAFGRNFENERFTSQKMIDMETTVKIQEKPQHDAKLHVGISALSDWNEKVIKAKRDFAIAFTKWLNSPEHKKMIEEMKRLGAIR